jgi:hypothetical protein
MSSSDSTRSISGEEVYVVSEEIPYTFNTESWRKENTWIYKLESTISGGDDNKTVTTTIYRKYNNSDDFVAIGTLNNNNIVLNENARPNEERELNSTDVNHMWEYTIKGTLANNLIDEINSNEDLNLTEAEKKAVDENIKGSNKKDEEEEWDPQISVQEGFGLLEDVSIKGRKARTSYGNYYYPEDLVSNKQDRIKFTMGYSEGTQVEASLVNQKSFQKKLNSIQGSVTLPIVTGISDQSSVDWKGAELNPLQSFAAAGALDLFNEARNDRSFSDIAKKTGQIFNTAKDELVKTGIGDALNVWLAQKAVGAQNLLSRTTGAIVNPNLEMLFNAPQLRNFGFTFLLSPRDADEATQVRNIIRFFKQGMSVKTTNSNVFLKAPNIFQIKYMTFNTDGDEILHPAINIIKTCALLSMDVQYTPNGTYMTYEDPYRTMQAYQLTMQFGELDPIYDNDYTDLDNDNDTVIGY